MSEEVATTTDQEILPYQGESWDALLETAHEVSGADFTKGDVLTGVPFLVTQIVIRNGDYPHGRFKDGKLIADTGCGSTHPYAYMRAVIGPERDILKAVARGRLTEEASKLIDPGEQLGWLEAGTGVYRNIVAYLESQGFFTVPEGPVNGPFGESRFDSLPAQWDFTGKGDLRYDNTGEPVFTANVRLHFPRGLRVSEYENEYTKEGRTRYPA